MSSVVLFIIIIVCVNVIPRLIRSRNGGKTTSNRRSPHGGRQPGNRRTRAGAPSVAALQKMIRKFLEKSCQEGYPLDQVMLPPSMIDYMEKCGLSVKDILVMMEGVRESMEQEKEEKAAEELQKASAHNRLDEHAGESYAAPIPEPHQSPMVGRTSPAIRHSQEHIAADPLKPEVSPQLHSGVAEHADGHIATTHAEPTPGLARKIKLERERAAWLAEVVPRGQKGLAKALVMKEILDKPLSLRRME
ncbi:MAG: hypothetical protein MJ202_07250 [Lentisphaeria bacterium]|nr:hypothetical protein [Lentisphaeria bacterium]